MLMSMRISQFDPKLKDGVAKVAAKLGPDQQMSVWVSDFEPTLKVVAATVAGRLGTDQRQLDFLRSSLRGSSRFPVFKTHGAPKAMVGLYRVACPQCTLQLFPWARAIGFALLDRGGVTTL